jgi:uncharacterized repeat protein (TIGR01451 family)
MRRQPANLLLALGLSCGLIAIVLAFLGAPGASVEAAPNRSIGTPTAPPSPTPEPTDPPPTVTASPTQPSPTAMATPTRPPPTPADPTVTPRPRRKNDPTPQPTPEPTATPDPPTQTAVPETNVEVSLHKTVDHDTRAPGQTAVYTLVGRNAGPASAYDVVISDKVPDEVSVIDLSSSKGDVVVRGQTVTAYPSVLVPGEAVTVKITVRVRSNAGPGIVVNTGTISTSTHDDPTDNSSSATFTIPSVVLSVQRLPHTDEIDLPGLFTLPIWLPWALVAGLFVALGMVLRLRGGRQVVDAALETAAPNTRLASPFTFQLPSLAPAGPPHLGPPLPPPAPPAPLPPLAPLDRDDALRDAIDDPL